MKMYGIGTCKDYKTYNKTKVNNKKKTEMWTCKITLQLVIRNVWIILHNSLCKVVKQIRIQFQNQLNQSKVKEIKSKKNCQK